MPEQEDFKEHKEDAQTRAKQTSENPRYRGDDGYLTPEWYAEKAFPEYHETLNSTLAANYANINDVQHTPMQESEFNQVHQLMSVGQNHASKAIYHNSKGNHQEAHAAMVAAAASYDTAAKILYDVNTRNHGLGKLPGNELGSLTGRGKGWGATIANAYRQNLQRRGVQFR